MQKIEYIKVTSIKGATFQPDDRTEEDNLKELEKRVVRAGGIIYPVILKDDRLVDGHRRVAIARKLGYEEVPAFRIDGKLTAWEWFDILNGGTRPINSRAWMQVVAKGYPVELLPRKVGPRIAGIIGLVGMAGQKKLARNNRSAGIMQFCMMLSGYCDLSEDEKFKAKTLRWLDDHNQQYSARKAIEAGVPKKAIIDAVNANRPLKPVWA